MRLFLILPVLILLACSSTPADSPDPDQYLDLVRRMHTDYQEQFSYLTDVTFSVPTPDPAPSDPLEPTPTYDEWKQFSLAQLAPRLSDLSRVNRFQRQGLAQLKTMEVPEDHDALHAALTSYWEAGIAWTDWWLEITQDGVDSFKGNSWDEFVLVDELHKKKNNELTMLTEAHINAFHLVNFILLGTPEPSPFNASGTSTAWALTPFPDVPTATLGPTPLPSAEPERLEITRIYEVRRLRPGEKVSQEEALFIHFRSWERLAMLGQAAQECGLYLDNFETRPVDTPEVRRRWNQMTSDRIRYEQSGRRVSDLVEKTLGAELHYRLNPEDWELVRPLLIEVINTEQETADSVELLLVELECPY